MKKVENDSVRKTQQVTMSPLALISTWEASGGQPGDNICQSSFTPTRDGTTRSHSSARLVVVLYHSLIMEDLEAKRI